MKGGSRNQRKSSAKVPSKHQSKSTDKISPKHLNKFTAKNEEKKRKLIGKKRRSNKVEEDSQAWENLSSFSKVLVALQLIVAFQGLVTPYMNNPRAPTTKSMNKSNANETQITEYFTSNTTSVKPHHTTGLNDSASILYFCDNNTVINNNSTVNVSQSTLSLVSSTPSLEKETTKNKTPKKPIALIIQAKYDHNNNFRPTKGFYLKQRAHIKNRGYEIIDLKIEDPNDLPRFIDDLNIPSSSIGFLWIRGHGAAKQIALSESPEKSFTPHNLPKVFGWVSEKFKDDTTIYLESCSTGRLDQGDFFNNMQFEFAKLTVDKPEVKIVAPSEDEYLGLFLLEKPSNQTEPKKGFSCLFNFIPKRTLK